jgi:protein-disulfide isomerase
MKSPIAVLCAVLLAAGAACAKSDAKGHVTEAQVKAYLLAHPEIVMEHQDFVDAIQDAYLRRSMTAERGKVESKLAALRKQIFDDPRDPQVGPRNAKVTVVEFFDYRCPHCKEAAPELLALIRSHPEVRFVFKEFPIFGEKSQAAAAAALAAAQQGKYLAVYGALMADKSIDAASIAKIETDAGLSPQKTQALAASPAIQAEIADVNKLATQLGVAGTPGFLVNDHYVVGADIPELTRLIAEQQKR